MGKNEINYNSLRDFYKLHPTMLSSPYTLHIDLFRKYGKRLTPLGLKIFSKSHFKDAKIYDFGCGTGNFLAFSKLNGAELCVGRDIENFLAKENVRYIDIIEISSNLPVKQESNFFDIVVCTEVLEHTGDNWKSIIRELLRITKKNGIIFISIPNYSNLLGIVKWLFEITGFYRKQTWAPFQNYTPQIHEFPLKSYNILNEIRKFNVKILEKKSFWWIDAWLPWIHRHPEVKLYTGFIEFLRYTVDNALSRNPYGGLQFYCLIEKQ